MSFLDKIRSGVAKYRVAREAALERDIHIGELKARRARLQEQVARSHATISRLGLGVQRERMKLSKMSPGPFLFNPLGPSTQQETRIRAKKQRSQAQTYGIRAF